MKECVLSLSEKTTIIGFATFKLPASTENLLQLTCYILFLTFLVYNY